MAVNASDSRIRCPKCCSDDLTRIDPPGLAFVKDYKCKACECQWQPAIPKWMAILCVVVGSSILLGCVWGLWAVGHTVPAEDYWDPMSQSGAETRGYGIIVMAAIPGLLFLIFGYKELIWPAGITIRGEDEEQ